MVGHGRSFPSHVERSSKQLPDGQGQAAGRKRKRIRGGGDPQKQPPPPPTGKGKEQGKGRGNGRGNLGDHPKKSPAGRFFTDRQGKQLCFKCCRASGGCTTAQCPNNRSHLCEICLQPRRTIDHRGGDGGQHDGGQRHA